MRRVGLYWAAALAAGAAAGLYAAGLPPGWALAVFAVLGVHAAWIARRRIRRFAWALTGDAVLYRSGGLWSRCTMARDSKVQAAALAQSPLDRRWGMATLALDTAGASATSHRLHVPYLPSERARELLEEVNRRAARTAFRW
jgi:putative membrane protein